MTTFPDLPPTSLRDIIPATQQRGTFRMVMGLGFAVLAALCQGVFLLPTSKMRSWKWEHWWLAFSATGMILCNWILALILLPSPSAMYGGVPRQEILILICFGIAWGVSAVM